MCADAIESKYQMLNKCKLLFDLEFINNNIYIDSGNILVRLVKFEKNFTKHNFEIETEGAWVIKKTRTTIFLERDHHVDV